MARIGLLAGAGKLPLIFARSAIKRGDIVIAFGLKGITDSQIEKDVSKLHWLEWGNLQKALLLLATERLGNVVMLGKLKKDIFFKNDNALDDEAKAILKKVGDRKDSAIFDEASKLLAKIGIKIIDSTTYLKELIPQKGVITKRHPTDLESEDIKYGADIAKRLAGLDIGQALVIKNKTVVAVETIEGTDETIARAGKLTDGGFAVVKMARPDQDMRFDIPTIGLDTIKAMIGAKASVLAMESGKTLLLDRDEIIKLADEHNISVVII